MFNAEIDLVSMERDALDTSGGYDIALLLAGAVPLPRNHGNGAGEFLHHPG